MLSPQQEERAERELHRLLAEHDMALVAIGEGGAGVFNGIVFELIGERTFIAK